MPDVHVGAAEAIAQVAAGRMVVVADDRRAECQADLVVAAEFATPAAVNFMARFGRGLICLALTGKRCDELALPLMRTTGDGPRSDTAFVVSIEARDGVTTGISAFDRARTIKVAVDVASDPGDLTRPGHIIPLRARHGGVLERPGHTEAAVDLARLGGGRPAGVTCQVLDADGAMARLPQLEALCKTHGLSMVTIANLVEHRRGAEPRVERVAATRLPTRHGTFDLFGYRDVATRREHMALVMGDVTGRGGVLARIHPHCFIGDVVHGDGCPCGGDLSEVMDRIASEGSGVLVRLGHDGISHGVIDEIHARAGRGGLAGAGGPRRVTVARDAAVGAAILHDLDVRSVRLLDDDPRAAEALEVRGLPVAGRLALAGHAELVATG